MSADDIHAMSEQLATDPSSLVFLPLAETLLARGDHVRAMRVAQRGAARHAGRADAHDLVARIALAQGDEARAEQAWQAVLALDPAFGTAHRGLGLLRYRQGWLDEARDHLAFALQQDPGDNVVRAALEAVQGVIAQRDATASLQATAGDAAPGASADALIDEAVATVEEATVGTARPPDAAPAPTESDAPPVDPLGPTAERLFDHVLEDRKQVALLVDGDGFVAAGQYVTADGRDFGVMLGAALSEVGGEADRAMRHFQLGRWTRVVLESEAATIEMAPTRGGTVVVAASREVPLGYVRRTLDRCLAVARAWLGGGHG